MAIWVDADACPNPVKVAAGLTMRNFMDTLRSAGVLPLPVLPPERVAEA
ncbi:MAG: hypothetical protein ACYCWC_04050 [Rhodocyclaceae bacterium]